MIDHLKIAKEYALKRGYDIVTPAGEKDGYKYFDIIRDDLIGIKSGWPRIVKVNPAGRLFLVDNLSEIMWASKQWCLLNKPRNRK